MPPCSSVEQRGRGACGMGRSEVEGDPDGTALMPSDVYDDPDATCHL